MEAKYKYIESKVKELGFNITSKDFNRPWGGFLVIEESQSKEFIECFFKNIDMNLIMTRKNKMGKTYRFYKNPL